MRDGIVDADDRSRDRGRVVGYPLKDRTRRSDQLVVTRCSAGASFRRRSGLRLISLIFHKSTLQHSAFQL